MAQAFLSIGSNIDRHRHISAALDALQITFGELIISPVYESEAVGFEGDHFLNLVVAIETCLTPIELSSALKAIEDANGRSREGPRFGDRTLDIDLLTYGDLQGSEHGLELPREQIATNAFELRPLADLVPNGVHPGSSDSYSKMWRDYSGSQALWRVDFRWGGRMISSKP